MSSEKKYINPSPTVDVILQKGSKILLIKRKKDPFKNYLALPGGFINEGETAEEAARRELKEETSLEIEPIEILGVYSDPKRDPRKHIMTVVFVGIITGGNELAGDDSAGIEWIEPDRLPEKSIAFDHETIISDYQEWKKSGGTFWSSKRRSS